VRDDLRRLADSIDVRAQQPATIDVLALSLRWAGLMPSALRILRDAQLVYPGDFWLRFQLGVWLDDEKDLEGAIRAYTAAVAIRPRLAAPYNNLGNSWLGRGEPDEAVACLRKAVELDPKYAVAHTNLGVALFHQQKPDEAIACYRRALALDPKSGATHYNLGRALLHQKKPDEAAAAFRTALALDPDDGRALNNLGALAFFRKDYDGAAAYFRRAIEADRKVRRKDANPYGNLGAALINQKQLDGAVAACRSALALDPKHDAARTNLARALNELARPLATDADAARRDPVRAVALAGEAVELQPQEGKYWATLGAARYRAGDWKAAIDSFEKSMERRSAGDGFDWLFLAMAHWQLGEKDKAREWYDRAVQWMDKNNPTDEELRRFRAESAELLELKEKQ
jgi:superkiller protein 3